MRRLCVLEMVCFHQSIHQSCLWSTFSTLAHLLCCLYICLLALWMSAYLSISLCICLLPHLLVCVAAFQPVCLGLLRTGDKLASQQPEAICHTPSLSALLCFCQLSAEGLSHSSLSHGVHTITSSSSKIKPKHR